MAKPSVNFEMIGKKFSRLTVIREIESHVCPCGTKVKQYLCKCDCGKEIKVQGRDLRNGNTKSCGCKKSEIMINNNTTHGLSDERLYSVWKTMIARCENPKSYAYYRYGGRGIQVCEEWKTSYDAFKKWALNSGYDENAQRGKCTIDRINNNGNYEPYNCRWVDMKTQIHNRG